MNIFATDLCNKYNVAQIESAIEREMLLVLLSRPPQFTRVQRVTYKAAKMFQGAKKYNDDALKKEEERRNKEQTRNQSRTKLTFYFPTLPNFSLFALLSRVAFVGKAFFFCS